MKRLSFLIDRPEFLLRAAASSVKGIRKVYALWGTDTGATARVWINNAVATATISDTKSAESFLSREFRYEWVSPADVPDEAHDQPRIGQLDLESELERNILACKIKSENEAVVLFLYHSGERNQFRLTKGSKALTASEKSLIGEMLVWQLENRLKESATDRKLFTNLIEHRGIQQGEIKHLQRELHQKEMMWSRSVEDHARYIVEKIASQQGIDIRFTKGALDKLSSYNADLGQLESALERSIEVAINSTIDLPEGITLDASDLLLARAPETSSESAQTTPKLLGRLSKSQILLDRYEEAARTAKYGGERIIGKIIGKHCNPPISNAAITDSLKNHADRIRELCEKFPERWPIIRSEFRSVVNILSEPAGSDDQREVG